MKKVIIFFLILFNYSIAYPSNITLKWDANTESDLAGYVVYYGYVSGVYDGINLNQGNSPIVLTILDPNDPNYVDNNNPEFLLSGLDFDANDYHIVLTAYDTETPINESGYSNEVNTLGFNIPTIPQNLTASVFGANRIDLTWDVSTDNKEVLGYHIYRDGEIIDNTTTNSYSDTTVLPEVIYNYTVTALDEDGNESDHSNIASAMTNDNIPPSIPQNLEVLTVSSSTIELEWEKSTDNVGVIGYDLYRDTQYLCTIISNYTLDFISHTDINLTESTLYTYAVFALDAANNKSGFSNLISATTLAAGSPPENGGSGGCFINILGGTK